MPTEQKNVALNRATFCRVLTNFIADLLVSTRANVLFKLAANIKTFFTYFHQLFFSTLPIKIKSSTLISLRLRGAGQSLK